MPYLMHYIRFTVDERKDYVFKVKSADSAWSQQFKFRAPANTGITRVATYGDMGALPLPLFLLLSEANRES